MKGYKVPEGWAIGWRNAIEHYPKDSEYAWGMNAVLESIEAFPLEELDENPWHTGTPTEKGAYLIKLESQDREVSYTIMPMEAVICGNKLYMKNDELSIVAWHKIEER